jgi:hypothetical protein
MSREIVLKKGNKEGLSTVRSSSSIVSRMDGRWTGWNLGKKTKQTKRGDLFPH